MHIALDESYREASRELARDHQLTFFNGPKTKREAILKQLDNVQILAVRRPLPFFVDASFIATLPDLQFIHKSGTGVEGFDLAALNEHGILLSNNQGVNASCVAEHVILLTLLTLRNSLQYFMNMRKGEWHQEPPPPGIFQLEGKTVGIVGMGAIGCQVARRLAGFGVEILAHQRHPRPEATILGNVQWVSLDVLLRQADVITLCVPLTPQTEKLIGAREFGLLKPTAVLINTSRGRVVDERALYEALVSRRILAAGLDVFESEPTPNEYPLLRLDNVCASPHIAGRSIEMVAAQIQATMREIELFTAGQRPLNLVNPELLERGVARAKRLH